jgi:hypothetical protein
MFLLEVISGIPFLLGYAECFLPKPLNATIV